MSAKPWPAPVERAWKAMLKAMDDRRESVSSTLAASVINPLDPSPELAKRRDAAMRGHVARCMRLFERALRVHGIKRY